MFGALGRRSLWGDHRSCDTAHLGDAFRGARSNSPVLLQVQEEEASTHFQSTLQPVRVSVLEQQDHSQTSTPLRHTSQVRISTGELSGQLLEPGAPAAPVHICFTRSFWPLGKWAGLSTSVSQSVSFPVSGRLKRRHFLSDGCLLDILGGVFL